MADVNDDENQSGIGEDGGAGFVHRIQRAWRETVGTYATDEGVTRNLVQRLVDFGALSRDESVHVLVDFKQRIEQNRKELDRRVDESIKRATDRLTVPTPAELEKLRARVDELEERLESVQGRRS